MAVHDVSGEELAKLFYHYHEVLAPYLGCKNASHPESWSEISSSERNHLVVAARLALLELEAEGREELESQKYFAKPGTAEWGC
jgi:hypothetical protein